MHNTPPLYYTILCYYNNDNIAQNRNYNYNYYTNRKRGNAQKFKGLYNVPE